MKSIEEFENKIICGDCFEAMKEIPDNNVDLILTDPPFNLGVKSYDIKKDDYFHWYDKVAKELYRILKHKSSILVETSYIYLFETMNVLNQYFIWRQPIICYITNGMRRTSFCGWGRYQIYLWYGKGHTVVRKRLYDLIPVTLISSKRDFKYPNPKFVDFYEKLIAMFSKKDDIVLDPFLGSGTTAIACKKLNRRYIGIEISPEYCKIAEERIRNIIITKNEKFW